MKIIIISDLNDFSSEIQLKNDIQYLQSTNGQRLEWCMEKCHAFEPWNPFQFLHNYWQQQHAANNFIFSFSSNFFKMRFIEGIDALTRGLP